MHIRGGEGNEVTRQGEAFGVASRDSSRAAISSRRVAVVG